MNQFTYRAGPGGKFLLTGLGRAYLQEAWSNPETTLPQITADMGISDHKVIYRLVCELGLGRKAKKKDMPKAPPAPKVEKPRVEKPLHKGQIDHWPDIRFEDHPAASEGFNVKRAMRVGRLEGL